jgi:hypothetical protein
MITDLKALNATKSAAFYLFVGAAKTLSAGLLLRALFPSSFGLAIGAYVASYVTFLASKVVTSAAVFAARGEGTDYFERATQNFTNEINIAKSGWIDDVITAEVDKPLSSTYSTNAYYYDWVNKSKTRQFAQSFSYGLAALPAAAVMMAITKQPYLISLGLTFATLALNFAIHRAAVVTCQGAEGLLNKSIGKTNADSVPAKA